jgi:dUTP pyrophosphatase
MLANSIGLIDAGYRGELLIRFKYITQPEDIYAKIKGHCTQVPMLTNVNMEKIYKKGERIAQLVIAETHKVEFEIVEELSETDRGKSGFGSTGA